MELPTAPDLSMNPSRAAPSQRKLGKSVENSPFSQFFARFSGGSRGELGLGLRFKLVLGPKPALLRTLRSFRAGKIGAVEEPKLGINGKSFNQLLGILIRAERPIRTQLEAGSVYLQLRDGFLGR